MGWVPDRHEGSCLLATARYTPSYSTRLQWKVSCLPRGLAAPAVGQGAAWCDAWMRVDMSGGPGATCCSRTMLVCLNVQ